MLIQIKKSGLWLNVVLEISNPYESVSIHLGNISRELPQFQLKTLFSFSEKPAIFSYREIILDYIYSTSECIALKIYYLRLFQTED